uniref:G-protein coupled receptors family 1 profile domain-containing protein n=1 Tax=Amphiprion ocellaris TaxID=80972 RepID=A0AAQ6A724_AMPOC
MDSIQADEMSETDFSTSPTPTPPPLLHCDYSDWSPSFSIIPSVYLLAFLVGCLSNSLVLWAYLDRAEGRRTRDKKLAGAGHLALADLCFLVTLPLWAVYTALGYHWPFGQPLCQISSFLTALNMYASVFSLSMLSVERYWVLTGRRHSSHHAPQSCSSRAMRILGGVWVLAGVLALPGLLLRSVREVEFDPKSEDDWHLELRAEMWWSAALSLKSTLIGFLLPLVILLVCYCSLAQLLNRHFGRGPRPDRRRQRRLLRVIVTLVMAFFLCWLPLHVNKTVSLLLELGLVPYSCSLDQILLAAHPYVTCLAYLNSCLNPVLYAACDPTFRKRCRGALLIPNKMDFHHLGPLSVVENKNCIRCQYF